MNDVEITADTKRQLLERKIKLWHGTLYDAQLDAKVAEALDDERIKDQAIDRMKKAHRAIDLLGKMLEEQKEIGDEED